MKLMPFGIFQEDVESMICLHLLSSVSFALWFMTKQI